jgi:hypothetical protein
MSATNAGTRVGSFFRPKAEAIQEILLVKVGMFDQALSQAQSHRRVVRPSARRQLEVSPSTHVGHRRKSVTTAEFDWSAEGVSDRQPNECAQGPIS